MMSPENKSAAIAALSIMLLFGVTAYYLPTIMLAIGHFSTVLAGAFAVLFVAAFFLVFWLRGRNRTQGRD
ncbi:hypothetical protein [Mesorhizobium amorphae]